MSIAWVAATHASQAAEASSPAASSPVGPPPSPPSSSPHAPAAKVSTAMMAIDRRIGHPPPSASATLTGPLAFSVTDAGPGFDTMHAGRGAGLRNMADRLDALGGHLTVTSQPDAPTTITGSLPVVAPTAA